MNVSLPDDLNDYVQIKIKSGQFLSEKDVLETALRLMQLREQKQSSIQSGNPKGAPIWELAAEIMKDVPDEELAKLPTDGAEQIDHYLYGSPKR